MKSKEIDVPGALSATQWHDGDIEVEFGDREGAAAFAARTPRAKLASTGAIVEIEGWRVAEIRHWSAAEIRDREAEIPETTKAIEVALRGLEGSEEDELYARLLHRYNAALQDEDNTDADDLRGLEWSGRYRERRAVVAYLRSLRHPTADAAADAIERDEHDRFRSPLPTPRQTR
jgi:aryl carrier-like protein